MCDIRYEISFSCQLEKLLFGDVFPAPQNTPGGGVILSATERSGVKSKDLRSYGYICGQIGA